VYDVTSDETSGATSRAQRTWRTYASWIATGVALLIVLFALIAPNQIGHLKPAAILRIPIEGLVGVALLVVLPARARRITAATLGALLGVMAAMKIADMGFYLAFNRRFDPMIDWQFFRPAWDFLYGSVGRVGAIVAVVGAALITLALPVVVALSVLRLTRLVTPHRTTALRTVGVLGLVWVVCAVLGLRIVPGEPVASSSVVGLTAARIHQVGLDLHDRDVFAHEVEIDPFHNAPGQNLLTGLKGKDFFLAFVESYGRVTLDDPEYAPVIGGLLDNGTQRLNKAGFSARSAFLTSSTFGGGSWLAHSTLLSGLWVDSQQRYSKLLSSDRLTLPALFGRAGWRTVAFAPANIRDWPEGVFYQFDQVYDARNLGYEGPRFSFALMPDQYTFSAFERLEHASTDDTPLMAELDLVSSHAPWAPLPKMVDWADIGDGAIYEGMPEKGDQPDVVWDDTGRVRKAYGQSIEYSLDSVISWVEKYGDDKTVLMFLGDHQPATVITGMSPNRDVPITIIAKDPKVLDEISGWGWQEGLRPGPLAPVWRMDTFRDRFLTAFGSTPNP
jgi:hypothetical protein